MTDQPTPSEPSPELDPVPPSRVGLGARDVALGAIVFVAALVLLLGATRLIGRGDPPGASPSASFAAVPTASAGPTTSSTTAGSPTASPSPDGSATADPNASPTPVPSGDPVLVGAGDIGDCTTDDDEATAALLDGIEGTVFTAGDNAYDSGTADEFRDCYHPTWGRHLDRTRPAPGNHDWRTDALAGYFGYFGDAAKGPGGTSWYSYDLGTWHVIVLDSECGDVGGCKPESPQGAWLAADLAATDATCTLAIFHVPRFSSGDHGDAPAMDGFWRPLYVADVDVIVNGHDHDYERFAPQDPDGREDREQGIREFVAGTGGTSFRDFVRIAPNSELRAIVAHGVLAFTLHDGSYDWSFITAGSDFNDSGTANCH